jgi:site-specific recombinase XerD
LKRVKNDKKIFYGKIGLVMQNYLDERKAENTASGTIANYKLYLHSFQEYLYSVPIVEVSEISSSVLINYFLKLGLQGEGKIKTISSILRCFFRYLKENSLIEKDISDFILKQKK